MRILKVFFLTFSLFNLLVADEPPSWRLFEISSTNQKYVAKLEVADKNSSDLKSSWSYRVSIYDSSGKKFWSCDYRYDGYPYGRLTDDGLTFVYIDEAYFEDKPIVFIYQNGKLKKQIKGREFNIKKDEIISSTSSFMWLGDERFQINNRYLTIDTIDNQKIVIDLKE